MTFLRTPIVRLTAWYVLIIMVISLAFSAIIYRQATEHFRAGLIPQERFFRGYNPRFAPLFDRRVAALLEERYEETVARLRTALVLLNLVVLGAASVSSFFLAKRTLRPIENALAEQKTFTADASHELRTPLAAMKAEIEVALQEPDTSEHTRILASNLEEIGKLERLSSSLLKLARHEDDRRNIAVQPLVFSDVAQEAIRQVTPAAGRKHITIKTDGLGGVVQGDRESFVDLLVILLDNAVKYGNDRSTITIHAAQSRSTFTCTVSDQGKGIPAADLPHLFQRFYRAETSRSKERADGFGLGLSIAKQIVDRHHGSIAIDSVLEKGTTVTLTLPVA